MKNRFLIHITIVAFIFAATAMIRSGSVQSGNLQAENTITEAISPTLTPLVTVSPISSTPPPSLTPKPTKTPTPEATLLPVANVPRIGGTSESTVVDVELSADPEQYQGSCKDPLEFTFTATVTLAKAGAVTYKWVKSDGTETANVQTLTFSEPGTKTVTTGWIPEITGLELSGWQKMKILSPVEIESNQASFSVLCSL